MTTVLLIEKGGKIRESLLKNFDEAELYKKGGFKTADGFECATQWELTLHGKPFVISLYGKTKGRAGYENKYDFPPPVDNTLFFGTCILVNHVKSSTECGTLKLEEWKMIYDSLFKGFRDIDDESSEEEEDDEVCEKTKEGYHKDGFIVDDDDTETEDIKPVSKKSKVEKKQKTQTLFDKIPETDEITSCELMEEPYLE